MAFTVTSRISDTGATATATKTSASFTPTANSLLVVVATCQRENHATAQAWSISDSASLTWTQRAHSSNITGNFGGDLIVWTAPVGGSPVAMTVTVDPFSTAATGWIGLSIFDITGHNVASPSAQAATTNTTTATGNSVSLTGTLGSAPTNGNLVLGMFTAQNDVTGAFAAITGFTALQNPTGVYDHIGIFYRSDTTTTTVTNSDLGQSVNWGAVAVWEVAADSAAATATPHPIVAGGIARRIRGLLGRAKLVRAPQAPVTATAAPRPILIDQTRRRPTGRLVVVRNADKANPTPPASPPLVTPARRAAVRVARAIVTRNPAAPLPPRPPIVTGRRRPTRPARAITVRNPAPPTIATPHPIVATARRAVTAGRAILTRNPQAPAAPATGRAQPPTVVGARPRTSPARARLTRNQQPARAYQLLNTFAASSADPHTLTITGATAGRDIYLIVNCAATITTPAGWDLVTSRVATMGSYIYRLPGTANPGGSIGVSLDLSAARAVAVVAIQTPYTDTAATYASLVAPINGTGSTAWGTSSHTFTAHDAVFALYNFHTATGLPTFAATGYDQGFTPFADTGWAGAGTGGDEGARILVGSAEAVGFTASGVVVTLDAAGPTGSAVGFLALNAGTPPAAGDTGRRPIVITARRAAGLGRALLGRAQATPLPPRPPIVATGRRRPALGRAAITRNPQAAAPTPTRRPQPIVIATRARRRAQQLATARNPQAPDVVAVPAAPQVTEPQPRRSLARIIVTRNTGTTPAAPATATPKPIVAVARALRRRGTIITTRTTATTPAAPATATPHPIVITSRPARRPLVSFLGRNPAKANPVATPDPVVVARRSTRWRTPPPTVTRNPQPPAPLPSPDPIVVTPDRRPPPVRRPILTRNPATAHPTAPARGLIVAIRRELRRRLSTVRLTSGQREQYIPPPGTDHAITLQILDTGHTATITDDGHTATARDHGHTATAREQR